jgi:hypothetical protein
MLKVYAIHEYRIDGVLVGRIKNLVPVEGLNEILTQFFKGITYTASPFIGLIDSTGYIAIAGTDTAAKITTSSPGGANNGWQEFTTYTPATRPVLTLGTAAAGAIDNSASLASFTLSGNLTLQGSFIASVSTKGGTTGKLISEAVLVTPLAYTSGQVLTVGIFLTASN